MTKRKLAIIPVLALIAALLSVGTAGSAVTAGTASDPLVSKSYADAWGNGLQSAAAEKVSPALEGYYATAAAGAQNALAYSKDATPVSLHTGGFITVKTGATVTLLSGSATVEIRSGAFVNVTVGGAAVNGRVVPRHCYVVCENGFSVVTAAEPCVIMVEGVFTSVSGERLFTDVGPGDWFCTQVYSAAEQGLMYGVSDTLFGPNDSISRAMVVAILYRLEGSPEVTEPGTFTDVAESAYYAAAVSWAQQNGVVSGYSSTVFRPDENITREQMAAILYRYAAYKGKDVSGQAELAAFTDAGCISEYAQTAVRWTVYQGLIGGMGDGTLSPQGTATRAQFATIITRYVSTGDA